MQVTPGSSRSRPGSVGALVAAIALSIYLATAGGSLATTDAVATFEITRSIVERGAVDGSPRYFWAWNRGVDGRYYSQFGLGQSIYNVPFYLAGRGAETLLGLRAAGPDSLAKAAVALGNAFAAATAVWLTFRLAWHVSASLTAATFAALSLAFGTLLWPYSKFGFNAPLAACCLVGTANALWVGTRQRRDGALVLAGVMLGAGLFTRHEFVLAVLPAGAWLVLESRGGGGRRSLRTGLLVGSPFLIALGAWLWFNHLRFGSPLYTGYTPAFGSPLTGLYGLLLTPGASLFLYCPLVLPAMAALWRLARRDRAAAVLLGGHVGLFLLFYATLVDWEGGRSYGPRYLVPVLPFLAVALGDWFATASRPTARALAALAVLSAVIQLPGVVVDFSKVAEQHAQRTGESHVVRHASWRSASLVLNSVAASSALPRNVSFLLGTDVPPNAAVPAGGRDFARFFAFSLDFWWMYAFYLRLIRAPVAVACGAVPVAAGILLAFRLRATMARERVLSPAGMPR